jgi:hypothetical protein
MNPNRLRSDPRIAQPRHVSLTGKKNHQHKSKEKPMQLYTVSFTTQTLVKKIGPRGKIVGETRLDKPITLTALPYQTAMSYANCDNFSITHYQMDEQRRSKGSGRDTSVGNGTKRVSRALSSGEAAAAPIKKNPVNALANAAASGNLGAALNV